MDVIFHEKPMTVGILTGSVGGKWGKFLAGFQECGSAGKEPPRMPPNIPLPAPNIHWADPLCLVFKPHLLVPTVAADEYLDGVLGDSRGGSWGLCLTHLWNGNTSNCFTLFWKAIKTGQDRPGVMASVKVEEMLCCLSRTKSSLARREALSVWRWAQTGAESQRCRSWDSPLSRLLIPASTFTFLHLLREYFFAEARDSWLETELLSLCLT